MPKSREDKLAYMKAWHRAMKLAAFNAYGGPHCACCGDAHEVFLCIDHVNGNGERERWDNKTKGGSGQYWLLKKWGYPEGYQVLCLNCNYAKSRGGCPHASED